MAAERLSMRKIKEVLRLAALGHSRRAIGRSVGISHGTVGLYLQSAEAAGLLGQAACKPAAGSSVRWASRRVSPSAR